MILRRLAVLAWFAAAAVLLAAQSIYSVGAENAAGPWGQADGTGCGNDIVKAAFEAAGVAVDLQVLPYVRAKDMVLKGALVGCFAMSWSAELEGKVVFAQEPLYRVSALLVWSGADPKPPRTAAQLKPGMRFGVVRGYEYPQAVQALVAKGILLDPANSEEQNLKRLALGRLDGVIVMADELKSFNYLVAKAAVQGKVQQAFVIEGQGSYLGFSLKHPDYRAAKAAFDRGFALIRKNGRYERIIADWQARS